MNGIDDMKDPSMSKGPAVRKRWLGPVLLLSLAVNLFLGAALVTGAFHRSQGPHGGSAAMGMPPHHMLIAKSLTAEERRVFHRAMHERFRALSEDFRAVRDARMALSRAVAAEPYDPVTTKAAFAEMRRATDAVADKAQSAMVESFASLSSATRARIAENLAKGREREEGGHWSGEQRRGERNRDDLGWPREYRIPPGGGDDEGVPPE